MSDSEVGLPEDQVELTEDRIPLDGIDAAASDLIELYGGHVSLKEQDGIRFTLPRRRGVAASGMVDCRISWGSRSEEGEGTVTIVAGRELAAPRTQHLALLIAGAFGAILWLLWPFFPNLGPAAWLGGLLAFAAYLLTLRKTNAGVALDLLQRLARNQREAFMAAQGNPE